MYIENVYLDHSHFSMIVYTGDFYMYISMVAPNLIKYVPNISDMTPNYPPPPTTLPITFATNCRKYFKLISFTWWKNSLVKMLFTGVSLFVTRYVMMCNAIMTMILLGRLIFFLMCVS